MITNQNVNKIETDEVLLNGTIVAKGSVSVSLEGELIEDELTGVSVSQERYGSLDNTIIYNFSARLFQVKFQDERNKYYKVDKDDK